MTNQSFIFIQTADRNNFYDNKTSYKAFSVFESVNIYNKQNISRYN